MTASECQAVHRKKKIANAAGNSGLCSCFKKLPPFGAEAFCAQGSLCAGGGGFGKQAAWVLIRPAHCGSEAGRHQPTANRSTSRRAANKIFQKPPFEALSDGATLHHIITKRGHFYFGLTQVSLENVSQKGAICSTPQNIRADLR